MIQSDEELLEVVSLVDVKLQEIQDYIGTGSFPEARIRFPRGFIRTASYFRGKLWFIEQIHVKDNLAYALIQTDVYRWLTNRTDIYGPAKEMIIKSGIALVGSICETLCVVFTRGIIGKSHSFCERCNRMCDKAIISTELRDELHWLWEARAAIHIYELDHREFEKYPVTSYNRAVGAARDLREALDHYTTLNTGI